jgi:hypothetical protein
LLGFKIREVKSTNIKGKPQSFDCKVEGSKWYHNGTVSSGLTIEEVWERVEPK